MDRNDGRTKYVLRGEGAGSVFVIDEKTGNIHVTKPLDREEKDEYRLIATATDRQTDRALEPSSQFIIRVQDINDNPPVFDEGPYSATVPEMANIGGCEVADNIWLISLQAEQACQSTWKHCVGVVCWFVQERVSKKESLQVTSERERRSWHHPDFIWDELRNSDWLLTCMAKPPFGNISLEFLDVPHFDERRVYSIAWRK